jgi:hypothetical protein
VLTNKNDNYLVFLSLWLKNCIYESLVDYKGLKMILCMFVCDEIVLNMMIVGVIDSNTNKVQVKSRQVTATAISIGVPDAISFVHYI